MTAPAAEPVSIASYRIAVIDGRRVLVAVCDTAHCDGDWRGRTCPTGCCRLCDGCHETGWPACIYLAAERAGKPIALPAVELRAVPGLPAPGTHPYEPRHGPGGAAGIWPRPQDGPGPASQEQAAEASAQGLARADREPDFSPPPAPGPSASDAAADAVQQAAEKDLARWTAKTEPPTTEMTAITDAPEEHQ